MAHIVDVRNGDGVFVVLGSALTLPSSNTATPDLPGSVRFNPSTTTVQYFTSANGWSDFGTSGGSTGLASITLSGDATGSNIGNNLPLTLKASGATAGTYTNITVNAKGLITSARTITASDITTALSFTPANIVSPTFTGTPKAPTVNVADNSLALVNSAFVNNFFAVHARLSAPRIVSIYVSPSGNDSNTGFTNTAPLQTIQAAWNLLQTNIDLNGHPCNILLADGSYTGSILGGYTLGLTGLNNIFIIGNSTSPGNVVIDGGNVNGISIIGGPRLNISGVTFQSSNASGLYVRDAFAVISNCFFGNCNASHISADTGGKINVFSTNSIVGGASEHLFTQQGGEIRVLNGSNVSIVGAQTFSNCFAFCNGGYIGVFSANAYSGGSGVSGLKAICNLNGFINTNGNAANYFPGTITGTSATGGTYN